jgi:hypothetical protein
MERFIVGLIVSFIAGAVFFVLAAMADGMSHSMNAMFTLFPYGTFVSMRTSWENTGGLVLTFIQFPVYALVVMILKGKRARIVAVLVILALHIIIARVELRSYRRSRGSLITSSAARRGVMFIARDQHRIPV